jgi:phage baseplate assembly protein W
MSSIPNRINAVDSKNKKILGSDIRLAEHVLGADIAISKTGDIDIASEETNLAQAILHRLRTVRGELLEIGHTYYGSRLYDFIGEPNNEMTRARLKAVVRDTLLQEPRIKQIVNIVIRSHNTKSDQSRQAKERVELASISEASFIGGDGSNENENLSAIASISQRPNLTNSLNAVDIDVTILPTDRKLPLNIVFPFYLEVT